MLQIIKSASTIDLGYAGENEARVCRLSYPKEWVAEFPQGVIEIHVKRAGDGAVYKAQSVTDDRSTHTVSWVITSVETSYAGCGEAQLCFVDNGAIVKSQRYSTAVAISTSAVTPTDPPPDTLIAQAVNDYIAEHVDVVTVSTHGDDGQILQSNGDGSYSWLTVTDPIIDSDTGNTLVPTRALNRLANAIRSKTGYEGDMTVETMAEVLEQTDMWTTEEYCMDLAPAAAELTMTLGALPGYAFFSRQNISKVVLPYCGRIHNYAFTSSSVSILIAPQVTLINTAAFNNCASLVEVNFPNVVNFDGTSIFMGCVALRNALFPKCKTVSTIMFSGCYALSSVSLPEMTDLYGNVATADSVFGNCRSLEHIELPKFKGVIRTSWFDACWTLKEAILPKLTQITGNYNFRNCYALEKLYAPECTVWTGTQNFLNCNALRRMCFYTKPTTISNALFSGAPVLQDIYVSWSNGEVAGAPWGAPAGCTVHYDTEFDADGDPIVGGGSNA